MKRLAICLAAVTVLLSGCQAFARQDTPIRFSHVYLEYFDTVTTVVGYETDQAVFDANCEKIAALLTDYHRLFDIYYRYDGMDNLCTLNANAGKSPLVLDDRILDMLEFSQQMHTLTGGKVNIAMGRVLRVWHDYRTEGTADPAHAALPTEEELQSAACHSDIGNMIIDREAGTAYLADPEMQLDVGAIGKGYAAECIAREMAQMGLSHYVLNIGGNIRAVGTDADGNAWLAGIQTPDEDGYSYKVSLSGQALVTSGDYQRYYTVNGVRYHHIIDPDTNMPCHTFRSVSVLCDDSGLGDALSTALFNMTYEEGRALAEQLPSCEVLWILSDGSMRCTDGFQDKIVSEA